MGREFAKDISPKKIIMTFCLNPDLAFKVKLKCNTDHIGLSTLLQNYLAEWTRKDSNGKPATTPKV